jgi:hypothetical protein
MKTNIIMLDLIHKIILENKPDNKLLIIILEFISTFIKVLYKYIKGVKSIKYPPKNNILVKVHITTILVYSAKKKNTNITAACSVINPLTNSDSASAKSKGALLVSAIQAIKNTIKIGNKGNNNQIAF